MANNSQKQGIFSIVLILLFALLPVFRVSTLVDQTLVPRQALASVAVGVLLIAALLSKPAKKVSLGLVVATFAGFLVMNFISVAGAINPVESWATISRYLLSFGYLIGLIYLLQHKKVVVNQIILGGVLFGGLASLITLYELFGALGSGEFFTNIYAVTGNFSHKNLLSSALMLALPFTIMGAVNLGKTWKKVSLVLVFLIIIEVFVLRTRGVWLSLFVAGFATTLLFLIIRKKEEVKTRFPLKLVALGGGIAVVLMIVLISVSGVKESLFDPTNLGRRFKFWDNSAQMISDHPVTGVGAGNWKINFPKYGLQGLDYNVVQGITHVQRPHNDFIWVLAEAGPLALAFFLGIFILAFWYVSGNFKRKESSQDLAIDLAIVFGLLSYLTFAMTDFALERTSHALLLMTLIGLIFRKPMQRESLSLSAKPVLLLALGGVVFSLIVSGYRWQGEKHSYRVLQANASRNARMMVPAAEQAINPYYNMDNYANPVYYYSSLGKLVLNQPQRALVDAKKAYAIAPYNIITLTQIGNVYKNLKQYDEALKYYDAALEISPQYEVGKLVRSEVRINQKRYVEALQDLVRIDYQSKDPRFARQLPFALQEVIRTREEHGKFPRMMKFMEGRQFRNANDYMQAYREYRRHRLQADAEEAQNSKP